jgi:hypothetical protein
MTDLGVIQMCTVTILTVKNPSNFHDESGLLTFFRL